jgi:hypothetical protein
MKEFIGRIEDALDFGEDHMMILAADRAGLLEETDANSFWRSRG